MEGVGEQKTAKVLPLSEKERAEAAAPPITSSHQQNERVYRGRQVSDHTEDRFRIVRRHLPGHQHHQWRRGGTQNGKPDGAASPADVRVQAVQGADRRRRNPTHPVLWPGAELQRPGDGPARTLPGGPVQLLQSPLHDQNGAHARGPDDRAPRIPAHEELHPPGHQAGQLPDGHRAALQQTLHDRLWPGEKVPGLPDAHPHHVPGGQEPNRNGPLRVHQCPPWNRAEPPGRHGIARLRDDVLQPGLAALAGPQGHQQEAKVRKDLREEDVHPDRGAV